MNTIRRMKILFSIWGYDQGGVATAFTALASFLESLGHEVKVVLSISRGRQDELVAIPRKYVLDWLPPVKCRVPKMRRPWLWLNCILKWKPFFLFAPKPVKHVQYDAFVMFHGQEMIWRWFKPKPSVIWFHEMASDKTAIGSNGTGITGRLLRWSKRCAVRGYDYHVATSEMSSVSFKEYFNLRTAPRVINNIIDCERIQRLSLAPQTEMAYSRAYNIVYLGRLSHEKGVDRLVEAFAMNKHPRNSHLWIIGAGPETDRLETLVKIKSMDERVSFLGAKENPYPYLKAADLLVLPSREEGLGLVLWEALLCGTSVLATQCGGTVDALNNGDWGLLVDNSTEGIALGIHKFLAAETNPYDLESIQKEIMLRNEANKQKIKILFDEIGAGIATRN